VVSDGAVEFGDEIVVELEIARSDEAVAGYEEVGEERPIGEQGAGLERLASGKGLGGLTKLE
jgi:hypothetical protein